MIAPQKFLKLIYSDFLHYWTFCSQISSLKITYFRNNLVIKFSRIMLKCNVKIYSIKS